MVRNLRARTIAASAERVGGHTPTRYIVETYAPGESVRSQFTRPQGLHERRGFRVVELGPERSEQR